MLLLLLSMIIMTMTVQMYSTSNFCNILCFHRSFIQLVFFCSFCVQHYSFSIFYWLTFDLTGITLFSWCSLFLSIQHISKPDIEVHAFTYTHKKKYNDQTFNEHKRKKEWKRSNQNATQRTEKIASTITCTIVFVFRSIHSSCLKLL